MKSSPQLCSNYIFFKYRTMKTIKDLPKGTNLGGIKVKTPNGVVGIWKSQWSKGVWLSDGKTDRVYPQFVEDLKECKDWEVTEERINCHTHRNYNSINNSSDVKKVALNKNKNK